MKNEIIIYEQEMKVDAEIVRRYGEDSLIVNIESIRALVDADNVGQRRREIEKAKRELGGSRWKFN